jgi:DNA-binding PadR family transcriptional regulator
MPDDQVKRFEKAMKKGFMSLLALTVLEKKPRHGYGIMKDIKDLTLGLWEPPASTMYTILDDLSENDLIHIIEEKVKDKRTRKVYGLTPKGEETLKELIKKQREMMKGMRSIIVSTLGMDEQDFPAEDIEQFINPPIMLGKLETASEEEKRELLEKRKQFLKMRIKRFKSMLQNIEKKLENLQKNE